MTTPLHSRMFKRYRMEMDFGCTAIPRAILPEGFAWMKWSPELCDRHAEIKFQSFRGEMDGVLFPNLSSREGCEHLIRKIVSHSGFLPEATWMIESPEGELTGRVPCGTIQGLTYTHSWGAILNVGVAKPFRGLGLGRSLVLKSLTGFRRDGIRRVTLDVTAENQIAVDLYRSIGFRLIATTYREVPPLLES
ncbi:GNAT family N-acetyltransferase [Planctomicrobium sp. SH668]|uniref:GNAT family N-acetyltransferase n=1 Tax=Planctomicrobium sp. SH668 TaxID=3448126 RepID=UPI003F5C8A63